FVLDKLAAAGNQYFVRQSYPRGMTERDKGISHCFLITHYTEAGNAQQHISSLKTGSHAFLYEWNNQDHRGKLKIAAGQPEGYKIYSALLHQDYKAMITGVVKSKIRDYIRSQLQWRPGRNEEVVPHFTLQYGELFVILTWRSLEVRVRLSDIEKRQ
ncbi:MAG: hypothetical protein ABIQ74_08280, partial [Chitinophagales bacterium]